MSTSVSDRFRRLCTMLVALLVPLAGLALATSTRPAAAAEPDWQEEEVHMFEYNTGFGDLPECGSVNVDGHTKGGYAIWRVLSSVPSGGHVEVGDTWVVRALVQNRQARNGNNGPDPLTLSLDTINGPAARVGPVDPTYYGAGEVLHGGDDHVGPKGPHLDWGYAWDMNSYPGVFETGDGVQAMMTVTVKATAPGVIELPLLEVGGYDGTGSGDDFGCDFPLDWSWTVDKPDVPPVGGPDFGWTDARYSLTSFDDANGGEHGIDLDVLANDDDPNTAGGEAGGDTAQVRVKDWTDPAHGSVTCGPNKGTTTFANMGTGPCTYTPDTDYSGNDSFSYTLRSVSGYQKSVPVTVSVLRNRAPSAAAGTLKLQMASNQQISNGSVGITDPDGDDLHCTVTGGPAELTINADTCKISYSPPDPAPSSISFTVRACDRHELISGDDFGTHVDPAPGYSDGNGDTPNDFDADDLSSRCHDRAVQVAIQDVDQFLFSEPVGMGDDAVVDSGYAGEYGPFQVRLHVLENDIDYGNNAFPASHQLFSVNAADVQEGFGFDPAWGSVSIDGDDILYSPAPGFSGPIAFQYRICDTGDPDSQQITALCGYGIVSIDVVPNAAPVANDDEVLTSSDAAITGLEVGANDSDPDGDALSCVAGPLTADPASLVSAASISADCLVDLTPADGADGVATMSYTVCDSHPLSDPVAADDPYAPSDETIEPDDDVSRCDTAVLTATIAAPADGEPADVDGDPPTCTADTASMSTPGSVEVSVLANDTGSLTVQGAGTGDDEDVSEHGGTLDVSGDAVTYTPAAGFTGTDTFTYNAVDAAAHGCSATVTVTVAAAAVGSGELPRTGDDPSGLVGLGVALLGLGAGFRLASRRRTVTG